MLNIMPCHCRYCDGGFLAMVHISDEARKQGLGLIELKCEDAEKDPVWSALAAEDPIFVNGFGHGNHTTYTGDSETPIFTNAECDILSGRVVYLLSCLTANELGPAIIAAGGVAYGGYNIAWTWMANDTSIDPYEDWYAEGFYRGSNEFPITLIHGESIDRARERCIAEYNRWIGVWETLRADDPYAAETIKWLAHDRDGLTVLGNLSATIVAAGIQTFITVEVEPPAEIPKAGETFPFSGTLLEKETGIPLSDKTINLYINNVKIESALTNADGGWAFDVTLGTPGVHRIYLEFSGDDEYAPAYSSMFLIEVGFTAMYVTAVPPAEIPKAGETFPFSGNLLCKSTGAGIPDRTVDLYINNVKIESALTNADGGWAFDVTLGTPGVHRIYLEFSGDDEYAPAYSSMFLIEVGFTAMYVTAVPPTSVDPGVTFPFSGNLLCKSTGAGIPDRTVDLYINNVKIESALTNADGGWAFDVTLDRSGLYHLYAKFNKNAEYEGSMTEKNRVLVPVGAGIFGHEAKGGSRGGGYIAHEMFGSWYSCPEAGKADSITVYLQQYSADTPRIKCAIYKKSDGSLVGYTEEWTLTSGWDGWKTFKIVSGGTLEATDYYLVFWTNNHVFYFMDVLRGKGASDKETYNSFPDPWSPTSKNIKLSIYCIYTTVAPPKWKLRVESAPISVPVTLDGSPIGDTPAEAGVEEGSHTVEVPGEVERSKLNKRRNKSKGG